MIKLNFIAEEVTAIKEKKIIQKARILYAFAWLLSFLVLWFNYHDKVTSVESYAKRMTLLEHKIDAFLPDFQYAVNLYSSHKKLQKSLSEIYAENVEPAFLLEGLQGISTALPDNFRLKELKLNSLDKKEFTDKKTEGADEVKALSLQGRVFFEQGDKGPNQVQEFVADIKKYQPFNAAITKLDLSNIKVGKKNQQYFYNFSVDFGWLKPFSL